MLMVIERGRSSKQVWRLAGQQEGSSTQGVLINDHGRLVQREAANTGLDWTLGFLTQRGRSSTQVWPGQQDDIGQQVASEGWLIGRAAVVHI